MNETSIDIYVKIFNAHQYLFILNIWKAIFKWKEEKLWGEECSRGKNKHFSSAVAM